MYCLLIKPSKINHFNWNNQNYINSILELIDEITIDESLFLQDLYINLETNKYTDEINIEHIIIDEELQYKYSMLYIDIEGNEENQNEVALLFTTNNKLIYGNVVIIKESYTDKDIKFENITKIDLDRLLNKRITGTILLWDEKWSEDIISTSCNLKEYYKIFFDDEEPEIKHIDFLMYNIHILYITSKYGKKYICGDLLNDLEIEKCLIYTMKTEDLYGHITLDEFKKMIKISEKVNNYITPVEYEIDNNRYTKYTVLDIIYKKI